MGRHSRYILYLLTLNKTWMQKDILAIHQTKEKNEWNNECTKSSVWFIAQL